MKLTPLSLKSLSLAALLLAAASAQADVLVYTDRTAFLAALSAPGTDTFNDLSNVQTTSPLSRVAGPYSYRASAGPVSELFIEQAASLSRRQRIDLAEVLHRRLRQEHTTARPTSCWSPTAMPPIRCSPAKPGSPTARSTWQPACGWPARCTCRTSMPITAGSSNGCAASTASPAGYLPNYLGWR